MSFIDLFCGCGGFTLGMLRAGFRCRAAIDFNEKAVETLSNNLVKGEGLSTEDLARVLPLKVEHAFVRDLTQFPPEELAKLIGTQPIDVLVGGPPCQGFSTARQVDGANHGTRLKDDPRRTLYREFLRYVEFFQPKIFVMENVLGMRTAAGGTFFTAVQKDARELGAASGKPGYRVHSQIEDAWQLGVPQKPRRQLIIGVRNDLAGYFPPAIAPAPRAEPGVVLGPAICDLPRLKPGEGVDECDYDFDRRKHHLQRYGDSALNYLFKVLQVADTNKLTNHVSRPHNDRDLAVC